MITFQRAEIKADPALNNLLVAILKHHKTPDHTVKHLIELKHVDDVCEVTTIFGKLPQAKSKGDFVYLSYEVSTWIKPLDKPEPDQFPYHFPTRVESITLYENFVEYETTRVREISAAAADSRDTGSLNLN